MIRAEVKGRDALMRRLNQLAPNIEKYSAEAKRRAGDELVDAIKPRAPTGATLNYIESIDADFVANRPVQEQVNITASKDPSAVGIFAKFIWRFLEFGTAPHNNAKGGGTVLGKKQLISGQGQVHPGTMAQPHIFPTYRAMKPRIRKLILGAVNKAVREVRTKR